MSERLHFWYQTPEQERAEREAMLASIGFGTRIVFQGQDGEPDIEAVVREAERTEDDTLKIRGVVIDMGDVEWDEP